MTNNNLKPDKYADWLKFDEAMELVKVEVEKTLTRSPLIIREYTSHLAASRGKFIRATSVIICAENNEGYINPDAVKIAAAVELLHLATLVHDDIIDDADLRRGEPTLQKKYGKRTAVICGDYLLSVALSLGASITDRQRFLELKVQDYVGKVCLGELNQHLNNYNLNLSIYQYLKIISGKTAALFEASFFAGAAVCGFDDQVLKEYKKLGNYIGMIFQLSDDCIDFDTSIEVANKPVQTDYENGVITLPVINAFRQLAGFKEKAASKGVTRDEINEAVEKSGGLSFTRLMIRKYYDKSMSIVNKLDLSDSKRARIIQVLNKASRLS